MAKTVTIDAHADSNGARNNNESTWSAARGNTPADELAGWVRSTQSGSLYYNGRVFLYFDLASNVPQGSTITAAKIILPAVSNKADVDSTNLILDTHTASGTIATSDYNLYEGNNYGSLDWTSISTSATTDVTINASGLTYLESNLTGSAKFCLRNSKDFNNSAPSGDNDITLTVANVDLEVTYRPPGGAFLFNMI